MNVLMLAAQESRIRWPRPPVLKFKSTPLANRGLAVSHPSNPVLHNGKLYVYGGLTSDLKSSPLFSRYDIATNTWVNLTSHGTNRRSPVLSVFGNTIFMYGGYDQGNVIMYSDIVMYDITTGKWSAGLPAGKLRTDTSTITIGSRIYIFGGYGPGFLEETYGYFDMATRKWTMLGTLKDVRYSGIVKDGDYIILVGGELKVGFTNKVLRYNYKLDTWDTLPDFPFKTHTALPMIFDGKLTVVNYYNGSNYAISAFVLDDNEWVAVDTDLPVQARAGNYQIGNDIYQINGFSASTRIDVTSKLTVSLE